MENIHVTLRVRPLNQKEQSLGEDEAWKIINPNSITVAPHIQPVLLPNRSSIHSQPVYYSYDYCFDKRDNNQCVYEQSIQNIVHSSLNGVNGSVLLYGQSGSGKTYTMMGYQKAANTNPAVSDSYSKISSNINNTFENNSFLTSDAKPKRKNNNQLSIDSEELDQDFEMYEFSTDNSFKNLGILILSLQDLFDKINKDLDQTYLLRCSYIEIYNDQLFDLLKPSDKLSETLTIGQDLKQEFYIKGVTEESVSNLKEVFEVLNRGEINRHYARTTLNHRSSRSHTIFQLIVQSITNGGKKYKKMIPFSQYFIYQAIRSYRQQNYSKENLTMNTEEFNTRIESSDLACRDNSQQYLRVLQNQGAIITESELNFVDLAGSQKVSHHLDDIADYGIAKDRLQEGQHINQSLFFLTQVIHLQAEGKPDAHIPYRNSPLTQILKQEKHSRKHIIHPIISQIFTRRKFQNSNHTLPDSYFISIRKFNVIRQENEIKVYQILFPLFTGQPSDSGKMLKKLKIKFSDEEAIRLLISEYEQKLRDLENSRREDQNMIKFYKKKSDAYKSQKAELKHKLEEAKAEINMAQFEHASASSKSKSSAIDFINRSMWHTDRVGCLFTTKNNINQQSLQQFINQDLKQNWQELIYDHEGQYAVEGFFQIKEKFKNLLKNVSHIIPLIQQFSPIINQLVQQKETLNQEIKFKNEVLEELMRNFDTLTKKCVEISQNTHFSRQLNSISILDNSELVELKSELKMHKTQVSNEIMYRNLVEKCNSMVCQENEQIVQSSLITILDRERSCYSKPFQCFAPDEFEIQQKILRLLQNRNFNQIDDIVKAQTDEINESFIEPIQKFILDLNQNCIPNEINSIKELESKYITQLLKDSGDKKEMASSFPIVDLLECQEQQFLPLDVPTNIKLTTQASSTSSINSYSKLQVVNICKNAAPFTDLMTTTDTHRNICDKNSQSLEIEQGASFFAKRAEREKTSDSNITLKRDLNQRERSQSEILSDSSSKNECLRILAERKNFNSDTNQFQHPSHHDPLQKGRLFFGNSSLQQSNKSSKQNSPVQKAVVSSVHSNTQGNSKCISLKLAQISDSNHVMKNYSTHAQLTSVEQNQYSQHNSEQSRSHSRQQSFNSKNVNMYQQLSRLYGSSSQTTQSFTNVNQQNYKEPAIKHVDISNIKQSSMIVSQNDDENNSILKYLAKQNDDNSFNHVKTPSRQILNNNSIQTNFNIETNHTNTSAVMGSFHEGELQSSNWHIKLNNSDHRASRIPYQLNQSLDCGGVSENNKQWRRSRADRRKSQDSDD